MHTETIHPVAAAMCSGMHDHTREQRAALIAAVEVPQTPLDWRRLEQQHSELTAAAAAAENEDEADAIDNQAHAIEAVAFSTPAADLSALRFKLRIFETDYHGAEIVWDALRADIERALSGGGTVTMLVDPEGNPLT